MHFRCALHPARPIAVAIAGAGSRVANVVIAIERVPGLVPQRFLDVRPRGGPHQLYASDRARMCAGSLFAIQLRHVHISDKAQKARG